MGHSMHGGGSGIIIPSAWAGAGNKADTNSTIKVEKIKIDFIVSPRFAYRNRCTIAESR
jgi:hypothetical protein